MERKKTSKSSARKSTGTRAKSSVKSRSSRPAARKSKKPKVYISSFKIMGMCGIVILICMLLLLTTNLISKNSTKKIASKDSVKTEKVAKEETKSKEVKKENNIEKKDSKQKTEGSISKRFEQEKNKKIVEPKKSEPVKKEEKVLPPVQKKVEEPKKVVPPVVDEVEKNTKKQSEKIVEKKETVEKQKPVKQENKFNLPKAKNNATLVFVFDDGGQNLYDLQKFLELPFPITIAVLPKLKYSVESAKRVRNSGHELILHQPMQAINRSVNPGPGAITPEMTEEEVRKMLLSNINEIGPIAGMNNHEGSAITADIGKMEVILKTASDCGIFFLDSRTNVKTVVPLVAKEMGYNYYERNIFLDNEKTRENALMELKKGLDIANKKGSAVMIGHVWSADFLPAFLKELYPELVKNGYKFSVVSES
jgi:polysaccharide deacetylase 2 family uncharacterized protein YibQ